MSIIRHAGRTFGGQIIEINPSNHDGEKIAEYYIDDKYGEVRIPKGAKQIELSQSEYDGLTEEEKKDPLKVYYIPDGEGEGAGGKGRHYSTKLLYDGEDVATLQTEIELSEPWTNFDALYCESYVLSNNRHYNYTSFILKEILEIALAESRTGVPVNGGWISFADVGGEYAIGKVYSEQKFAEIYGRNTRCVYKIYGIHFGTQYEKKTGNSLIKYNLGPGDGTNSRTFNFYKAPKKVSISWKSSNDETAWGAHYSFIWGDDRAYGFGGNSDKGVSNQKAIVAEINYGTDGKSFTLVSTNAGGACNTDIQTGYGQIIADYGLASDPGSGGGSVVDINPTYDSGTEIAKYSIDGIEGSLYVPKIEKGSIVDPNVQDDPEYDLSNLKIDGVTYKIIDVDGNVNIEQTDEPTDLRSIKINDDIYLVPVLEFNPEDEATNTLNTIKLNGVTYRIPSGGTSGSLSSLSDVRIVEPSNGQLLTYNSTRNKWENNLFLEANPEDEATDSLTKIKIGSDVFEIEAGGGTASNVELTQAEYDVLTQEEKMDPNIIYFVTDTPSPGGITVIANPEGEPTDQLNTIQIGEGIYEIVGGGSGGGSGLETEIIYQNETTTNPATVILNNAYTNYDIIVIRCLRQADNTSQTQDHFYLTKELSGRVAVFGWATSNNYIAYDITSNTELTLFNQGSNYLLYKIYGIKFSSGGSGLNAVEIAKEDYDQITPVTNRIYFVHGESIQLTKAHNQTGTTFMYSNVSEVNEKLAIFVALNNTIYAGFFFDVNTRESTVMTSTDLEGFAEKENINYVTNSTVTITQDTNTPYMYWLNGSNHDTVYLDATDLTNVGTRCGYSGCTSYLYYDKEQIDNGIFLNGRRY